jgi:hypothetical protein
MRIKLQARGYAFLRYAVRRHTVGYFAHFNLLTMYASLSNRLLATIMLFSLLSQSCRSGLRAITEDSVLKQDHSATANHVQASGEVLLPDALVLAPSRAGARVDGVLGSMSPTELAAAVVPTSPRLFMGPFTASSGERVLLGQRRGQWQAVLQGGVGTMMYGRTLPVVSSGNIEASLEVLQGQDVWSSRSRIHVLPTSHPLSIPCIYVGKLGLLGGAPTQQAQSPVEEWLAGPTMQLDCNTTSRVVYQIPPGYHYKGCRLKEGSEIQRARLTIHYVASNNEATYRRLEAAQNAHTAEIRPGANVGQVLTLVTLEGGIGRSAFVGHEGHDLQRMKHAGLVLYGSTRKSATPRLRSMMDIQVEILVEKLGEAIPAHLHGPTISGGAAQEDIRPPMQDASLLFRADSLIPPQAQQRQHEERQPAEVPTKLAEEKLTKLERQALPSRAAMPVAAFGAKAWETYFGEVGAEPPLPPDIVGILGSICPFWAEKTVKDTHLLVLIPATVAGRPFSLNLLGELVQRPKGGGCATRHNYYNSDVREQLGARPPRRSYWVLMTRDVLESSRKKDYASQKALVACHAGRAGLPYALPGALEAATVILAHYVRSGERLYADTPCTYTRCQELVDSQYPAAVGGYSSEGLYVYFSGLDYDYLGVASLRKFPETDTTPAMAFGARAWKKYFGEVGAEPCLPPDIDEILGSVCPFRAGKAVKDTHLLVLVPATVAGRPFSLNLLGELVQLPKGVGYSTKYRYCDSDIQEQLGAQSPASSYWILMTREVLEGSRYQTYTDQKDLLAQYASRTGLPYGLPGVLEAATAILSHYVRSGERLYADNPWTYTRCQELVAWVGDYPIVVGGFSSGGLDVSCDFTGHCSYVGMASFRKF